LKKLNAENTKLKNNIEKIVKMKSTEEMNNIKGNIKKIKSVNLKKNARVRNQRNRIKKNQNSYTAGEKKTINRKYQNSMSKTMQVISLFKKINALKNIGRTGQDNASRISIMKVGKKYERLKKGGIFSEDLQKEKTQNYEQNLDQSREQNQEQNKGKVRSRIR
ncbi:MAG: hypothetical protein LBV03_01755, partial [Fusobacteriales bacterium]|nr:hypothetical protein [Fusobacteriales bacterium]